MKRFNQTPKKNILFFLAFTIFTLLNTSCSLSQPKGEKKSAIKEQKPPLPQIILRDSVNKKFTFSNKIAGFYLGNTHKENISGFDGWTVDEFNYLKDYEIYIDGRILDRKKSSFHYYPHGFIRQFPQLCREEFTMIDSVNILLLEILPVDSEAKVEIKLKFQQGFLEKNYSLHKDNKSILIRRKELNTNPDRRIKNLTVKYDDLEFSKHSGPLIVQFILQDPNAEKDYSQKELLELKNKRRQRYERMAALQHL